MAEDLRPPRRIRVHRPVVCEQCRAEMSPYGVLDWFRCLICGSKRR